MRILFITSTRVGDAVLSTGLLGHLVETHPGARMTVVCGPPAASLFRAVPGLERVIVMAKRPLSGHWPRLWGQVVGRRWDLVVDLRNSPVSRLLVKGRLAVPPREGRGGTHQVERLARTLGLSPPPSPRLWFSGADRAKAAELVPPGPPVLALAPVANWAGKTWPVDRFADLAHRLTAPDGILPGARVMVLGTEGERAKAGPLLDAVEPGRRIDLMGRTDPLEAGACLTRCALFIGNDSGLMHIAAAVGVPTLGLFGPSRSDRYGPWGAHAAFVEGSLGYDQITTAPGFSFQAATSFMGSLSVDAVAGAARVLWEKQIPRVIPS
ncbi:MAG TPA: glycosyltransferase family 9 protein [Azospirillaceae bacterium]|nr:glycosyltransferase family 9 protein [Azospirillaceae bacterium]